MLVLCTYAYDVSSGGDVSRVCGLMVETSNLKNELICNFETELARRRTRYLAKGETVPDWFNHHSPQLINYLPQGDLL